MKDFYLLQIVCLFLLAACSNKRDEWMPDNQAMLSIKQFPNGDCHFVMGDSLIEALLSPVDGGKLISLKYKGKEILTQKDIDKLAYGSTFWPSPHDWGWPPASAIDRDAYTSTLVDNKLVMEGPLVEKLGLRFIKDFTISVEDTTLNFTYLIVNESNKVRKVAPWEVTRVPKGGFTFFPVLQEYPSFESVSSGMKGNLYYCMVDVDYSGRSQKINFDGTQGWLAHAIDGVLLVKKFTDLPANEIAPKEGDVQIYIDDDTDYMELENQGAYVELMPRDTVAYRTTWYLTENLYDPSVKNVKKLKSIVEGILE